MTPEKPHLSSLFPQELADLFPDLGPVRAVRLFKALQGSNSQTDASLLSAMRKAGIDALPSPAASIVKRLDAADGSIKLSCILDDGKPVECVLLSQQEGGRLTACVSSQVGCAMGCSFCRTATMGLDRSLSAHEIIAQYRLLAGLCSTPPRNVVFMGMGEPLDNLDQVRRAAELLVHHHGAAVPRGRLTISTCGPRGGITRLAQAGPKVPLAVSLISADHAVRASLMPVSRGNPPDHLRGEILDWCKATGRQVTIEIILIDGITDTDTQRELLLRWLEGLDCSVNLILFNPWPGCPFEPTARQVADEWHRQIMAQGIKVTTRFPRGRDVLGACGQLAADDDALPANG